MRAFKSLAAGLLALAGTLVAAQIPSAKTSPLTPQPTIAADASPVPAPAGPHELNATDVDAWLDGYMPFALHNSDIAGAVVTVVKDGQIVSARGYGYADIATRRPVDPYRTLFRPGSVSKLVTWTAVMQQVEAAKDIITYDPKQYTPFEPYLKRWVPRRIYDPGTTPAYSNWATTLAGYIVQRVSRTRFDDYVEQRIFAPLGMRHATFRQPVPPALAPLMATGYPRASQPAKGFEYVGPSPAGSLSASGVDMARFMIAHLANGRGILQPATAQTMHDSPLDHVDPISLIPPLNRMELGFFETNVNGREVIGHLGDLENFHTSLHLFLREGVGFYVSFNSAGREGGAHVLRGQLFQDFADRYFPSTAKDGRVDPKTAAEHARMMVGVWQNSRHSESNFVNVLTLAGQTKVGVDDKGALVVPSLTGAGGGVQKWEEIAPFVWRDRNGHDRLAARVVDGKVVRWSFDGISPFMMFDRVPASRSSVWLVPALVASLAILALTFLYWPGSWYVRRRYQAAPAVTPIAFRTYRATRIMALLVLAVLGGWVLLISMVLADNSALSARSDGWLWLLQIAGAVVFVGAVGISGWNAWLSWRDGRRWTRKLWNSLVFLSTLVVLYVASGFGLLAMTVHY